MKVIERHGQKGLAGRYDASMLVDDYSKQKTPPNNDELFTPRHRRTAPMEYNDDTTEE